MARRPYDPLDFIPSPEIVRQKLTETLTLAERLRILLEVAERLRMPAATADRLAAPVTTEARGGRPNG